MRVGVGVVHLKGDPEMVIAGGIHPVFVTDQEGDLRATAVVLDSDGQQVAIVSLDVLMMAKEDLEEPLSRIEREWGIPSSHILVACTHTHHAPSTVRVHGYDKELLFVRRVQDAIVEAVGRAREQRVPSEEGTGRYWLGIESSVGQNSRLLLSDGTIYWGGPRDDALRPTGPFDPELPVLAWTDRDGQPKAVLFNHACHNIGTVGGAVRSPSFYGLACQGLEEEIGGIFAYLPGAAGSSHNLTVVPKEAVSRIKEAVRRALGESETVPLEPLRALAKPFTYRVRLFDDQEEEERVSYYCKKRLGEGAERIIEVFRRMREVLLGHQGEKRVTEIRGIRIGEIALIGLPGEVFTVLGWEIKRRSPFRNTIVVSLANDWIGYIPDEEGFRFGGYQVWTGFHSYVEEGTGERMVEEAVGLLKELAR